MIALPLLAPTFLPIRNPQSEITPVSAAQLVTYDAVTGEPALSGTDIDANGKLDPATNDRLAKSDSSYEQVDGDWWKTTQSWTFPKADDATPVLTGPATRTTYAYEPNRNLITDVHNQNAQKPHRGQGTCA